MYLNEVFLTYLNYPIYLTYVIYQSIKSINSSLISPHPIWHDLHSNQIYSCLTKSNQIWSSVFTFCMHSVWILYAFYMHSVCILCFYMERPVASKRRHPVCARCCATLARPGEKMRSPCSTRCRVPLGTVLTPRGAYEAYEAYEVSVPYLEVIHADSWPHI